MSYLSLVVSIIISIPRWPYVFVFAHRSKSNCKPIVSMFVIKVVYSERKKTERKKKRKMEKTQKGRER